MRATLVVAIVLFGGRASAAGYPKPVEADVVLKDFRFATGESLDLKVHYRTIGQPRQNKRGKVLNAVLIMHGTTGSGAQFVGDQFAGELFGAGQPLDAGKYYLIIPDAIGHGKSSKPSDGLHAKFPRYGYEDMIRAQHRLLTEGLKVEHLRLVMGTSMGGMHTWLWGQKYPEFMDALLPLACLPTQISGRNRLWRHLVAGAIRTDPEWKEGEYTAQPRGLRLAAEVLQLMSSSPVVRQRQGPTLKEADAAFAKERAGLLARLDANDTLYALESSRDYDPGPGLKKIRAPLLAINFADDLINPPELGILEREIKRVKKGQAIVIPTSKETVGHGTHTKAAVWKEHLENLMKETEG
ncbi:MAG TPA: alpha/beta fold hydrolase [Gemmataceae bacterium]|jgi:homoserine O-acetyltransferase